MKLGWFFITATAILLSSCNSSTQEYCENQFTQFEIKVQSAQTEIKGGRSLASVSLQPRPDLAEWARGALVEMQRNADLLSYSSKTKPAAHLLLQASDYLVSFHGYALQGDSAKMLLRLEQIQEETSQAHAIACSHSPQRH